MNYIEHLLIVASAINGCVFISTFSSLVRISVGITSSVIKMKICEITMAIKKYKSIIKKKKYLKKCNKIVFLEKTKLNKIKVLISKALSYSYVSHD